jgi:hypothetical protein
VRLEIVIGAADARRLLRLAIAAGLTAEACAASIVAEVLADDAAAHREQGAGVREQGSGVRCQEAAAVAWDEAGGAPPAGGWLQ